LSFHPAQANGTEPELALVKDCFGQAPVIVRLQPFSPEEQRLLFQSYLPDEDFSQFENEAARFELTPLLGNPQFLRLFADAYVQGGRRFTTKKQIFVDATERLASELNTSLWQRDRPSTKAIVSAADDIFAKLLLSGASGSSIADEGDVDFPYFQALSETSPALRFVPNTRLLKPSTEPDRHEPVHRIVAEYCAARNLAAREGDPAELLSLRRLLSVIAPNSVVRDELRGVLGWMAALGDLAIQEACIRIDPYAVLSNGDPSQLAASSKRLLLTELKKLSEIDPYFRRSDAWRRFSVAGFFDHAMIPELPELLTGRDINPELRNLILEGPSESRREEREPRAISSH
jgi:AcrR family transcriptional regulator